MKYLLTIVTAAALVLWWTEGSPSAPACQSKKNPVACEVGGQCIWTVTKGKPSKCLPLAKAKAPRQAAK